MTVTGDYERMRRAFAEVGHAHGLTPTDVRVVLAVAELDKGMGVSSLVLEGAFEHGGGVRRTLSTLYRRGLAIGQAESGGSRRPGVRTRVKLSVTGRDLAQRVQAVLAENNNGGGVA